MTFREELQTRNFSIYGQWTGVICIFLCFAVGIAAIFDFGIYILFAVLCLITAFLIIFIEIPLLMRICPTSPKFDSFIRRFETNYMRAAIYLLFSVIQWLSLIKGPSPLIAAAVLLLVASIFYALAGIRGQGFIGSKTLGGQGIAQMIV